MNSVEKYFGKWRSGLRDSYNYISAVLPDTNAPTRAWASLCRDAANFSDSKFRSLLEYTLAVPLYALDSCFNGKSSSRVELKYLDNKILLKEIVEDAGKSPG